MSKFWKADKTKEQDKRLTKEELVDKLIGEARCNNEVDNDEMLEMRRKQVLSRMW